MSIYTSMSGMLVHLFRQNVTANNIANVNTTAFKSSRSEVQENFGSSGAHVSATARSHARGAFMQTDRNMDIAVEGRGFFTLRTPSGDMVYTRDGTFHVDAEGELVTANGYRLEPGIKIPDKTKSLQIAPDGNVFAINGGSPEHIGRIELSTFFNPQGLTNSGDNLYRQTAGSGPAIQGIPGQNGFGTILSGSLETSNVNVVKEMTDMIINQRGMEVNLKAAQTHDRLLGMLINLKK